MRNGHGYNSSLGPTSVGAIQAPVRGGPKAARVTRHPPVLVQSLGERGGLLPDTVIHPAPRELGSPESASLALT